MILNSVAMEQKRARPEDRLKTIEANKEGLMTVDWGMTGSLPRQWAKDKGWPAPLLSFKKIFIRKMLENDENFTEALQTSGIEVWIPG